MAKKSGKTYSYGNDFISFLIFMKKNILGFIILIIIVIIIIKLI